MGVNGFSGIFGAGVAVVPHDALTTTTGLDGAAVQALGEGAVLLPQSLLPEEPPHTLTPAPTLSGKATMTVQDGDEPSLQPDGDLASGIVAAYVLEDAEFFAAFPSGGDAAVMTPETAQDLGLTVQTERLVVFVPGRALSEAEAVATATAAQEVGASLYVERGYQPGGPRPASG